MGEPSLGQQSQRARARSRPGSVILLGAVVSAYGATWTVWALLTYLVLARPPVATESPELAAFRTPDGHAALWMSLVLSGFLTASGLGIIRTRDWARSLFLALGLARIGVTIIAGFPGFVSSATTADLVVAVVRDVLIFAGGAWYLTRPRIGEVFHPEEERE